MLLGVDYYPEQWDGLMTDGDLDRICELGCNVIRIGEFSWHRMEKREGEYDFSYFDDIIAKAKARELKVIIGTPTATPPAWLIHKHPDIIQTDEYGRKRVFGGRHTYCFSSEIYVEYCKKIVRALAEHYKNETSIIAWQIDNELGHEGSDVCWCDKCKNKFDAYLANKYGNTDVLNEAYGTAFWSQEYNSFDEVPLPYNTITTHNPSLRLDYERFCSQNIVEFLKVQADIIKSVIPDAVVLHDFPGGGLDKSVDYSDTAKYIDKVAYNNYPVWGGQMRPLPPHEIAFGLDYARGLKGENIIITEAIMGAQGHNVNGFLPRPNQAKMWSYESVARGADGLLYFRYREGAKGAEQFCYGIIDCDNVPRRKFCEAQSFFKEIRGYGEILATPFKSECAMIYSFDSLASMRLQPQSISYDNQKEMKKLYKAFFDYNVPVDIIPAEKEWQKYKLLIIPALTVCDDKLRKRIKEYVNDGGNVIMTYRTSVKDVNNNLTLGKVIPVDLDDLIGGYVRECESVEDEDGFVLEGQGEYQGKSGRAGVFRDMLVADKAQSLFRYGDEFYSDCSAVLKNSCGKGKVWYIGTSLDNGLLSLLVKDILASAQIKTVDSPVGVEVVERGEGKDSIRFIINHNDTNVKYGKLNLRPFECLIERAER